MDDWGAENDGERGIIARLVPGNPEEQVVSPSSSAPVITGQHPLFLWIPDTPVVPPSAWTTGVPRMTAGGGIIARLVPAQCRGTSGIAFIIGTSNNGTAPFVLLDSRHPSRPAFGVDDWGAENDGERGIIARLVPQSRRTSGIAFIIGTSNNGQHPLFFWIPDTPVVPPSAWTTGVPRMTARGASLPGLFRAIQKNKWYRLHHRHQ